MRAIVVYESRRDSTESLARAIASGLGLTMSVEVVDSASAPPSVDGYDLLVVGGPEDAHGIHAWLDALGSVTVAVPAAAFDAGCEGRPEPSTRADLDRHGFETPATSRFFRVPEASDVPSTELDAAAAWARDLSLWAELHSPVAI